MPSADIVKSVRQENRKRPEPLFWVALMLAVLAGVIPARSECLSPSATAGATTTTVYRCPDGDAPAGQRPAIVDPGKTTTVERGSADLPWFEPKPTTTADPIVVPKASAAGKEDVIKVEPKPEATPEPTPVKEELVKAEPAPDEALEAQAAKPEADKPKTTKAKATKAKATKTRLTKAKRTKVKAAKRTKAKADERAKVKLARDKRKAKAAKSETKPEQVKTEPAKADDKVITWTRKDMSLGNRIVNWLGF